MNYKQLDLLKNSLIDWNVNYSVYPYNGYTINEVLCQFFDAINNGIIVINNYTEWVDELIKWIKKEGLEEEVNKALDKMLEDGTLDNIINTNLLGDITSNLDKLKKILNTVVANIPYTDYERNVSKASFTDKTQYIKDGVVVSKNNYGTYENGTVMSIITGEEKPIPQILGTDTKGLSRYTNRDSVGLYVHNKSPQPILKVLDGVTYTSNTCVIPSAYDISNIIKGMVIDTLEPRYVGVVTGVDTKSNTISVDAWYKVVPETGSETPGIPQQNTGLKINMINKIWGINTNIFIEKDCPAGTGFELGVFCSHPNINDVGGIDVVNFGNTVHYGFKARGTKNNFLTGFISEKSGVHFEGKSSSKNDILLQSINKDGTKFTIKNSGEQSKIMGNLVVASKSTTIPENIVNVMVNAQNVTLTLPKAEPGKEIRVITVAINTLVSCPNGSGIITKETNTTQVDVSPKGHRMKATTFLCDGNSWYILNEY